VTSLEVEAVQARLICVLLIAVAERLVGALGAVVSAASVVAFTMLVHPLAFPAASFARTL
jgi:hypothetical protein